MSTAGSSDCNRWKKKKMTGNLKELVVRNRSYRRFRQDGSVSTRVLTDLVDMARMTASGRNAQPLKYKLVNDPALCREIFPLLSWAGYLADWPGPAEGERPSAYIVVCNDASIAPESRWDQGIAAQTLLLGAVEKGLGGCMIGAFHRKELTAALNLPPQVEPALVIALGEPVEEVVLVPAQKGEVRYFRDPAGRHYVPKRPLEEVLLG